MHYKSHQSPNSRGSALIITMIAIGILTAMAAASLQRTTTDNTIAGRWAKSSQAREAAEGGLLRIATQVRSTYSSVTPNSFNSLLGTMQTGTSNGGQFSVLITDNSNVGGVNQDGDTSAGTDSDRIFRLTSTGVVGVSEQVIDAFYKIDTTTTAVTWPPAPTGCLSPPCNSAALLCGSSDVSRSGSSSIDGSDYPYPDFGCTGSNCDVAPITGTSGNYDLIGDDAVNISGSDVTSLTGQGSTSGCSSWQSFYDQWANVSTSAPGVVHISGGSYNVSNDCSTPKIFIVDTTSSTLNLGANTYMCGTFIFKSNTTLAAAGTATMVGAILLMGNYGNNAFNPATGTINVLGKVILRATGPDTGIELGVSGSSKIFYSTAGMDAALQAVNNANTSSTAGGLQLIAWRTKDK